MSGYSGRNKKNGEKKMSETARTVTAIKKAKKIAVAAHVNPDGDTIGSMLSLGLGLKKAGKQVFMLSRDGVPKRYRTLPGASQIRKTLRQNVDLAITVDCNAPAMVGPLLYDLKKKAVKIIAIDHHEIREPFEDISLIDTEAAAVGEMVYSVLSGLKINIDKRIAANILTSLIVETSSFRFPNVKAATFDVCAKMVRTGVDFYELVNTIFWSNEKTAVVLAGIFMARCKFPAKGRLAWTMARIEDFRKVGGKEEDIDALPDMIRAIKGVDIAVLFREKKGNRLRVSLRAKKNINVGNLAKEYGGGGHPDVAGCYIGNTSKEIKQFLLRAKQYL